MRSERAERRLEEPPRRHYRNAVVEFSELTTASPHSQIWARGPPTKDEETEQALVQQVKGQLTDQELSELTGLCARCLFGTLFKAVDMIDGGRY